MHNVKFAKSPAKQRKGEEEKAIELIKITPTSESVKQDLIDESEPKLEVTMDSNDLLDVNTESNLFNINRT
jgi:hypothetical protein